MADVPAWAQASHLAVESYSPPSTYPYNFGFPVAAITDCFNFYLTPVGAEGMKRQLRLRDPSNRTVPAPGTGPGVYSNKLDNLGRFESTQVIALPVPIAAGSEPTVPGAWKCELKSGPESALVNVTERRRMPFDQVAYRLPVNVAVYSDSEDVPRTLEWVDEAMREVARAFQQAAIDVVYDLPSALQPVPAGGVSDDFLSPTTSAIVQEHFRADAVTLVLIENLIVRVDPRGRGRAGGIPGPQGFNNGYAACLVCLADLDLPTPENVSLSALGLMAAHELAHYLGLTHGSAGTDEHNLMYYKVNSITGTLNDKQIFQLRNQPVVQLWTRALRSPVHEIKLTIRTGTQSFCWFDGAGTDMNISFWIGSDDTGQSWDLNSLGEGFEAGEVKTFTLSVEHLCREDLKKWAIATTYSAKQWAEGGGVTVIYDVWNFAQITIMADDSPKPVDDFVANMFLGGRGTPTGFHRNIPAEAKPGEV